MLNCKSLPAADGAWSFARAYAEMRDREPWYDHTHDSIAQRLGSSSGLLGVCGGARYIKGTGTWRSGVRVSRADGGDYGVIAMQ